MRGHQSVIAVTERSQVGEARREANRLAELVGFSEVEAGNVAIVASELATNLARYAREGRLLLQTESTGTRNSVVLLSDDRGPGMDNVASCLTDGYSTGGTPGNGLGAVRRLSTVFDLYSSVPGGTVLYARIDQSVPRSAGTAESGFTWGVVGRPMPRETVSGDAWRIQEQEGLLAILMADGLGHGPDASAAAELAGDVFDRQPFAAVSGLLNDAHDVMRGSRGGAVAYAQADARRGSLSFAGVGNISGSLRSAADGTSRGLFSHNGTVGVQVRKVQTFDYEYPHNALLILHSDGLQSRWSLDAYPGLAQRHPGVIAGVLARDFDRGRDDVTVAVIRRGAEGRSDAAG